MGPFTGLRRVLDALAADGGWMYAPDVVRATGLSPETRVSETSVHVWLDALVNCGLARRTMDRCPGCLRERPVFQVTRAGTEQAGKPEEAK